MAVRIRRKREWLNADGVRGLKLELEQFLSEHGVDICLLNETHLESGRDLRFANFVCHGKNSPTRGGGRSAILFGRSIDHYVVPVTGPQHLQSTTTHLVLATRPVKLVVAYLSPSRPFPVPVSKRMITRLNGG
jgi:hypothetical protein